MCRSEIPEEKDAVWQCVTSVVNYSFFGFAAGGLFGVVGKNRMFEEIYNSF
jgi:hypothetical protein